MDSTPTIDYRRGFPHRWMPGVNWHGFYPCCRATEDAMEGIKWDEFRSTTRPDVKYRVGKAWVHFGLCAIRQVKMEWYRGLCGASMEYFRYITNMPWQGQTFDAGHKHFRGHPQDWPLEAKFSGYD